MMKTEAYLQELRKWKVLSEWKIETLTQTLRITSECSEWAELVAAAEGRSILEKHLDAYTAKMYVIIKQRADRCGLDKKELEQTEQLEKEMREKISKMQRALFPRILLHMHRMCEQIFSSSSALPYIRQKERSEWADHLMELVLIEALPPNVRMYIAEEKEPTLYIWLSSRDPFTNVDMAFLRTSKRVVVVQSTVPLSAKQKLVLEGVLGPFTVEKRSGPTEDRTQVTGFKVPGATATP